MGRVNAPATGAPRYVRRMFTLDAPTAARIIAEEDALATLRQHPLEDVLAAVEDRESISSEEEAFNALMQAMYNLRPQGWV